ncbi:thiamine-binding protein [Terrimonas alba]|uniref:thiamine-binding protein n=1 Tax=Terrimonas alba TaxID=3349636 RepID=UPI0035F4B1FA
MRHEVGPFATVLEGTYDEVTQVIHAINEFLYSKGCAEWISNVQLQIRSGRSITANEKTDKFR